MLKRVGSVGNTAAAEGLGATGEEECHWQDLLDSTPGKLNVALSILRTHRGVW